VKKQLKIKEWKYYVIILIVILLIFYAKGLFDFLLTENLAGLDLIGNYSFVWLMHKFLGSFSINGWTNLWFAGMPAFTFYPPLFFVVTSILNYISLGFLSLEMSYKLVIFGSLLLLPLPIYYSTQKMKFKRIESFFIVIWSLSFLFLNGIYSATHQTLNFGLVAQMFALDLFIIFIGQLFASFYQTSSKNLFFKGFKPGVLLALVILSHVYVGVLAMISLLLFLIVNLSKKTLKYILFIGVIGFLFSVLWLIPALLNINFLETYGWNPMDVVQFPILLIFFSLFLFLGLKKKDKNKLFLILMFLVIFFIGTRGLPFSRIQYDRFFFFSFLFGSILAGIGCSSLYNFCSKKFFRKSKSPLKTVIIIVLLLPLIFLVIKTPIKKQWETDLEIDELNEWIKENIQDGRILVENDRTLGSAYYTLMERIPIETGKPVLNELHVDSSISSPYTLALQYGISDKPKKIPVCTLCHENISKDKELILSQMKRFNVKYVIANSKSGIQFLDDFLISKNEIDQFYVFETPIDESYLEIPKYKPVLVISDLNQWKEFSEFVFMKKNLQDLVFIQSEKIPKELEEFGVIISLKDEDVEGNETLIYKPEKNESLEDFIERVEEKLFVKGKYKTKITKFNFTDGRIQFHVNCTEKIPILVKFSYFPNFLSDERIYLANPTLMLVFGKGDVEIKYTKFPIKTIAELISIFFIMFSIVFHVLHHPKKSV